LVLVAPTGAGKTLTFWMLLLFNNNSIFVVVMALNILGAQNEGELEVARIKATAVTAENATDQLYKMCLLFYIILIHLYVIQECVVGIYRAVVTHPEHFQNDQHF
jgi:hypothetical protein